MDLVVSDSSTLIHLARIGQLSLLKLFFDTVTIPPAVWREVVEQGLGKAGAFEVKQADWIKIISPTDNALVRLLRRELDDGEAEAIALAIERRADLLIIDEAHARGIAELYGLKKTGVVGLLIRAKQEGHIDLLKVELDKLRVQAGFRIKQKLYDRALSVVGE